MLARTFSWCSDKVKVNLFRAYCTPLYTAPLWLKFKKPSLQENMIWGCLHDKRVAYSCSWQTIEPGEASVSFLSPLSMLSGNSLLPLWSLRALHPDTWSQLSIEGLTQGLNSSIDVFLVDSHFLLTTFPRIPAAPWDPGGPLPPWAQNKQTNMTEPSEHQSFLYVFYTRSIGVAPCQSFTAPYL